MMHLHTHLLFNLLIVKTVAEVLFVTNDLLHHLGRLNNILKTVPNELEAEVASQGHASQMERSQCI